MKIVKDESGDEIMRLFVGDPPQEPQDLDRWQPDDKSRFVYVEGVWQRETPGVYEKMDLLPFWGKPLEAVVNALIIHHRAGRKVWAKFNGVPLYSDLVTMDRAYKKITGMTKADFDAYEQQQLNK